MINVQQIASNVPIIKINAQNVEQIESWILGPAYVKQAILMMELAHVNNVMSHVLLAKTLPHFALLAIQPNLGI